MQPAAFNTNPVRTLLGPEGFWEKLDALPQSADNLKQLESLRLQLWKDVKSYSQLRRKVEEYSATGGFGPSPLNDILRLSGLLGALRIITDALDTGHDPNDKDNLKIFEADLKLMVKQMKKLIDVTDW